MASFGCHLDHQPHFASQIHAWYTQCMVKTPPDGSVLLLDEALLSLRRMWLQHPERRRRFLAELGVSVEFGCIRTLFAIARCNQEPPSVAELAEFLVIDPSTASRLVNQVVEAGFALRKRSSQDRRRTNLALTPAGQALVKRGTSLRRKWLSAATTSWSDRDVTTLATLLKRLHADLEGEL